MKSAWRLSLGTLTAVALSVSASAQDADLGKAEITAAMLAPNLYVMSGSPGVDSAHPDAAGGRTFALVGPDGIFAIDAQWAQLADKVVAAIRKISPAPIRFLVNTHLHADHTGGNATFGRLGATILGREELLQTMEHPPATASAAQKEAAKDPVGRPSITYGMGAPLKFHMNGEVIDLIPVRAAHTGADTMIEFEHANIIVIGDFYRNFGYPFIDINNGGSLKGTLEALDQTMKLARPDTKLIPGHGTIITRTDLIPYRDMVLAVQAKVKQLIAEGKTLKEVLAAKLTAPYDAKTPGGPGSSADRFVTEVYEELKGAK